MKKYTFFIIVGVLLSLVLATNNIKVSSNTKTSKSVIERETFQQTATNSNELEYELVKIAEDVTNLKNQVLVDNYVDGIKGFAKFSKDINPLYEPELKKEISENISLKNTLKGNHITYNSSKSTLEVDLVKVKDNKATLQATENTIRTISIEGEEKTIVSSFQLKHIFTFEKYEDKWKLTSDKVVDPFGDQSKALDSDQKSILELPQDALTPAEVELKRPTKNIPKTDGKFSTYYSLNRNNIVNYAYTYWSNYNPKYRRYDGSEQGGDCTNFASQCLRAGGWRDIFWTFSESDSWWYDWWGQSRSWVNVGYFAAFTSKSSRGYLARYVNDLEAGDILQSDFGKNGSIDHTTVVTYKDRYGNLFLTYHSTNTLNLPFSEFVRRANQNYPQGSNYFAWRMYNLY